MARPNYRAIKSRRPYLVEQAARTLSVHKNTVRRWIKQGLPTVGGRGPVLMQGADIIDFLVGQRVDAKRPCPAGHVYCLKCRAPRRPAGGMGEYVPLKATSGDLSALCGDCMTMMHRRTKEADLDRLWPDLEITRRAAQTHLRPSPSPSLNSDS